MGRTGFDFAAVVLAAFVVAGSAAPALTADPILLVDPDASIGSHPGSPGDARPGHVAGEIVVQLKSDLAAGARARLDNGARVWGARTGSFSLDALADRFRVREIRSLLHPAIAARRAPAVPSPLDPFFLIGLGEGQDPLQAVEAYRKDPGVLNAQLNYLYAPDATPNDPLYPQQWAHPLAGAPAGWSISTGSGAVRIIIAIIGTGMQLDHPDLAPNIVPGYDFFDDDPVPAPGPSETHETSVAGVAAAAGNNGLGIAGVCWGCRIMPLRVNYTTVQVAQAVAFAVDHGARVVNMSFGNYDIAKYGPDTAVEAAINDGYARNVVMVATAGNDAIDAKRYPAALATVIDVAATDRLDGRASFSNFGSAVDVAAPGAGVLSTIVGGGYGEVSGTSFSAPYVSGLAGLILAKNPALAPGTVRLMIEYTADRIAPDRFIGSGRVNVGRALALNGEPAPAAVLKAPWNGTVIGPGDLAIEGTALGAGYSLDYRTGSTSTWVHFDEGNRTVDGVLGTFRPASLGEGPVQIRLSAIFGGAMAQDQVGLYRAGDYPAQAGWPRTGAPVIVASPVFADLDHDGRQEVVIARRGFGNVEVLRSDGSMAPGWPPVWGGIDSPTTPSVGDIDGDGEAEIVVASRSDAMVTAWHKNGTLVAGFPRYAGKPGARDFIWGAATLANLDGDPALEIITLAASGTMSIMKGNGTDLPGWPQLLSPNIQSSAAVGDLDGDGRVEIVVRQSSAIYVLRPDGSIPPGWPRPVNVAGGASPVLCDLDGDGTLEIIDAGLKGGVGVFDRSGILKVWAPLAGSFGYSSLSVGDLYGDGRKEIFIGDDSGVIQGLDALGGSLPGWPVVTRGDVNGAPLIADLDGDGLQEVIAASADGTLRAWHRDGSPALVAIAGSGLDGSPAVGDLDGDGDVELIGATVGGDVVALDLPGSYSPDRSDWPMFQHDARHTGLCRSLDTSLRPRNFRGSVSTLLSGTVDLAWDPPVGAARVAGYELSRNGVLLALLGPGGSYSDRAAAIGVEYRYALRGFDSEGRMSPPAVAGPLTLADTNPPGPPGALAMEFAAIDRDKAAGLLVWTAATDNIGVNNLGIAQYRVFKNGHLVATQPGGVTSYLDSPLKVGSKQKYYVVAVDVAGNISAPTETLTVTVPRLPFP